MENISILPNPFKILEQQIAKKESLNNKCISCVENDNDKDENNEDGFTNLKGSQSIKEGFKEDDKLLPWWVFILIAIFVSIFYGLISRTIIKIPNFEDIKDDDNTKMISKYKEYLSENNSSKKMNLFVLLFIGMSYLGALIAIEHENKMGFVVLIGFIMFVLSKSTAIIDFFENTFGYLFLIISGLNLNTYMRSDNFESIINQNPDNASISFNPLITLFNMENFAEKFTQIRFIDDSKDKNKDKSSSDFFAYFEPGESKHTFFKYLLEKVKQKRIIGNSIWLLLTTFFTIGIMKGTNV